MAWATFDDVIRRLPGRPITASSKPSAADITQWLTEAEAEVKGALAAAGYATDYTGNADALSILKAWVTDYGEARLRMAHGSASGTGTNDDGTEAMKRYEARLLEIHRTGAMLSSSSSTSSYVRSPPTDDSDDDFVDAEFTRDMEF